MTDYPADMVGLETPVSASAAFAESSTVPALPAFDAAKYRSHIESLDLTAEQERELLETLWSIMYSFVELGFSVDVCTAVFECSEDLADQQHGDVESLHPDNLETASTSTEEEGPA